MVGGGHHHNPPVTKAKQAQPGPFAAPRIEGADLNGPSP